MSSKESIAYRIAHLQKATSNCFGESLLITNLIVDLVVPNDIDILGTEAKLEEASYWCVQLSLVRESGIESTTIGIGKTHHANIRVIRVNVPGIANDGQTWWLWNGLRHDEVWSRFRCEVDANIE